MRRRAQVAALVDDFGRQRGVCLARIDWNEAWGARQKRGDNLFVLLRFARAGRVDEPAAWRDCRRGVRSIRSCAAASAGRSSSCRRQRMSGSRRSVPRPEHGASTTTQSNRRRKGRGAAGRPGRVPRWSRRLPRRFAAAAPSAGPGRRTPPRSAGAIARCEGRRLAAGRRARVEHPAPRDQARQAAPRAATPRPGPRTSQPRIRDREAVDPAATTRASGAKRPRVDDNVRAREGGRIKLVAASCEAGWRAASAGRARC